MRNHTVPPKKTSPASTGHLQTTEEDVGVRIRSLANLEHIEPKARGSACVPELEVNPILVALDELEKKLVKLEDETELGYLTEQQKMELLSLEEELKGLEAQFYARGDSAPYGIQERIGLIRRRINSLRGALRP